MFDVVSIVMNRMFYRPYVKLSAGNAGRNFKFGYSCTIRYAGQFSFGDNFYCGPYCYFSTNMRAPIRIGDSVMLGSHCRIIGGNHNIKWADGRMMDAPANNADRGIAIESDVWLGSGAVILDGAHISEGSVIGGSAVVSGFIPPYVIATGVPARNMRARFSREKLTRLLGLVSSEYSIDDLLTIYERAGVVVQ